MTDLNERAIEAAARNLGRDQAARLDVERVSGAVLARLRRQPARAWWAAPALLRRAAAVALVAAVGLFAARLREREPAAAVAVAAPVHLQALTDDELVEVLNSLAFETAPHTFVAVGLADLDESELTELLAQMEG